MNISQADSDTLLKAADFLCLKAVTGTNILSSLFKAAVNIPNKVLNLAKKAFKKEPVTPKHPVFNH